MTTEEVQKICPKATNITITGSVIGIKVGEFDLMGHFVHPLQVGRCPVTNPI